ncbi:MAG TPA: (Fe-S)-binding protein [Burkholderiaceae bacterium]|nr:(Fe-S)-binding protein [Burkholderiaceae bacterium]
MRVALFVTCLVDAVRPEIGFSVIKLLEASGCEVVVPESQTCCGQPAYNSGDSDTARALAEKVLREFEGFDFVVIPSGSCGGQIRVHYLELFRDHPDLKSRAEQLAGRVYEVTDFLASVLKIDRLSSQFSGHITYHDSCCGLRELGVKRQPRQLLALLPGVRVSELAGAEQCCGFGGTFSIKFGDVSGAIVDEKCRNIRATGADTVVLGDLGCMLNIEGRLRRTGDTTTRVLHIAEVLSGDVASGK